MKVAQIEIEGLSPILFNRFFEENEKPETSRRGKKDYGTPREQAEKTLYQDKDGTAWMPCFWITGALKTVASDYKLVGTRKSVKSIIGGAVRPLCEKIYFNEGYNKDNFEIDSRPVVIQRARIQKHRARFEDWSIKFELEFEDDLIDPDLLNKMLVDAGRRAGIGDYRPQKGGSFGRYLVTSFKHKNVDDDINIARKVRKKPKATKRKKRNA